MDFSLSKDISIMYVHDSRVSVCSSGCTEVKRPPLWTQVSLPSPPTFTWVLLKLRSPGFWGKHLTTDVKVEVIEVVFCFQ